MNNLNRNQSLLAELDASIRSRCEKYFGQSEAGTPNRGPVEFDYWSVSYKLMFTSRSVFVKIPKMNMRERDIAAVLTNSASLESARTEFDSFLKIHAITQWPEGCSTVRPLDYAEQFNAIITEYSPSEDLFRQCRAAMLPIFSKSEEGQRIRTSVQHCGEWLRHFQEFELDCSPVQVDSRQVFEDIRSWADEIMPLCSRPGHLRKLLDEFRQESWSSYLPRVRTCEGFEARNILVDRDGVIRVVDPGKIGLSSGLEDLAHFLASLTMLYWGTPFLWLGIPFAKPYRQAFLEGWSARGREVDSTLLAWFEVREWFRQWLEAYKAVAQKRCGRFIRGILRSTYVDTFFLNRIEHCSSVACGRRPRLQRQILGEES